MGPPAPAGLLSEELSGVGTGPTVGERAEEVLVDEQRVKEGRMRSISAAALACPRGEHFGKGQRGVLLGGRHLALDARH